MKIKVFISGLIRVPIQRILEILKEWEGYEIYMFTWTGHPHKEILVKSVTQYFEQDTFVAPVTSFTKQMTTREDATFQMGRFYRLFYGIRYLYDRVQCEDDDIIIRIRTDTLYQFDKEYLKQQIKTIGDDYMARENHFGGPDAIIEDWFGIGKYKIMKKIWCFDSIDDYNNDMSSSWNTECVIRKRAERYSKIRYIDQSKCNVFLFDSTDTGYRYVHRGLQ